MSKEEKLIEELSKMPLMVIETAYLHALNYTLYGEDVTEKWLTATQNTCILEKAYKKGYYDALQRQTEERNDRKDHPQLITKQSIIDFYNTQFPDLDDGVHWSRNDIIQNLDCIEPIEISMCEGGKNENTKSN